MPTISPVILAAALAVQAWAQSTDFERKNHPCSTPPQVFAMDLFEALESTEKQDVQRAIYEKGFGRAFQANFPFPVFSGELQSVKERLGVGPVRGRPLEARMLVSPYITAPRDAGQSAQRKRMPQQGFDKSRPFDVVMITSSGYGKIEQRVTVGCEDGVWKAFGVWYNPAY